MTATRRVLAGVVLLATMLGSAWADEKCIWQVPADAPVRGEAMARIQQKLARHVRQMVETGHMAPLRVSTGESGGEFWFVSPGSVAYSLAVAIPYLPETDRAAALRYLKSEVTKYAPHSGVLPLKEGARREWYREAPEFYAVARRVPKWSRLSGLCGLWAYGHYTGDWETVGAQYDSAKEVFIKEGKRVATLQDVQGMVGFARIARALGRPEARVAEKAAAQALLAARDVKAMAENAAKLYNASQHVRRGQGYPNTLYKGFWDLTPELGRYLAQNVGDKAEDIRTDLEWRIPMWYASRAPVPNEWWPNIPARAEDTFCPPRISGAIFLMRAYIAGNDAATLEGFLDIPYCPGDLDYIQQCVALLRAYHGPKWIDLRRSAAK